jgi:hypothetical protein
MSTSFCALICICLHSHFSSQASRWINPRLYTLSEASGVKHSQNTCRKTAAGITSRLDTSSQHNLHFPIFVLSSEISRSQPLINTILKSAGLLGNFTIYSIERISVGDTPEMCCDVYFRQACTKTVAEQRNETNSCITRMNSHYNLLNRELTHLRR